jgi:hypothetical protein
MPASDHIMSFSSASLSIFMNEVKLKVPLDESNICFWRSEIMAVMARDIHSIQQVTSSGILL